MVEHNDYCDCTDYLLLLKKSSACSRAALPVRDEFINFDLFENY